MERFVMDGDRAVVVACFPQSLHGYVLGSRREPDDADILSG